MAAGLRRVAQPEGMLAVRLSRDSEIIELILIGYPDRFAQPGQPDRMGKCAEKRTRQAQKTDPIRSRRTDESSSCLILVEVSSDGLPSVDRGSITFIIRASGASDRSSAVGLEARYFGRDDLGVRLPPRIRSHG